MTLSTFGAIMGFAADLAGRTGKAYLSLAGKAKDPALKETLQQLAAQASKTLRLMEQTRRENVTEMILEPIAGLLAEDYEVKPEEQDQEGDAGILRAAHLLEERERKFFQDASAKLPLPEAVRVFRRVGQKKEENLMKLGGLKLK